MGGDDNEPPCGLPPPSPATTTSCSTSTAACGWDEAAVEGAPAAVDALREAGKGIAFLTNDVRHAPEDFVRKLWRLGFKASVDEVVTCGAALQFVLASARTGGAAFVIGAHGAGRPCRRRRAAGGQQHGVRHARGHRRRRRRTRRSTSASCASPRRPCCAARS